MKVEVNEMVAVAGSFGGRNSNMLHVDVKLTFDIPPTHFSAGMTQIVMRELQNAIVRLLDQAKKKET